MSYDLEYFTEFLADPSAPDIADFYDMVRKWGTFISEHKGEFNYLLDDEWKEIRERLIEEFQKREVIKEAMAEEFDELCEIIEHSGQLSDDEKIEYMHRQLDFMKTHQKFYEFKDEDLAGAEQAIANFVLAAEHEKIALENLRHSEIKLQKSIAEFDDALAQYQEKTGKTPVIPVFRDQKKIKGN